MSLLSSLSSLLSISWLRRLALAIVASALAGCANAPYRPYVTAGSEGADCPGAGVGTPASLTTPEFGPPPTPTYTLHFLEFDDQGWPYPDPAGKGSPGHKIDCAIGDLVHRLKHYKVMTFVYVHGWHHSAAEHDEDVAKFRTLLDKQAKRWSGTRQVVGYYIGWDGETLHVPGLKHATFWTRKNAAHKVAEGSVREFFARMKAIRNHANRPRLASPTDRHHQCRYKGDFLGPDCPLRTVMIGHSFGAWILFASTSPFVMETLAGGSDVLDEEPLETERERGIADLILLLNPAFEATRYDPLFNAARRYRNPRYQPPLLVSITSTADWATGMAFPAARVINSILQYPARSTLEARAMKRTHGHMDEYLSHELTLAGPWPREQIEADQCPARQALPYQSSAHELRKEFIAAMRDEVAPQRTHMPVRTFCGDLHLAGLPNPAVGPLSIVWNIRTHADIIPNHDRIHEPVLEYFLSQLYEDIREMPRFELKR